MRDRELVSVAAECCDRRIQTYVAGAEEEEAHEGTGTAPAPGAVLENPGNPEKSALGGSGDSWILAILLRLGKFRQFGACRFVNE